MPRRERTTQRSTVANGDDKYAEAQCSYQKESFRDSPSQPCETERGHQCRRHNGDPRRDEGPSARNKRSTDVIEVLPERRATKSVKHGTRGRGDCGRLGIWEVVVAVFSLQNRGDAPPEAGQDYAYDPPPQ